jgi:integrase
MALKVRDLDNAEYKGTENARCVLWDDDPRGLGLRIFPSGRKSWVLSYRTGAGTKRLLTLGDYGTLALDQARKLARKELVRVESDAADPMAEKQARRVEAATGSVEALFDAYLADVKPKRADELLRLAQSHIFPKFGSRNWRELRRSEAREWHQGIKAPYSANRALQAARAAFYWRLWREDDAPGNKQQKRDTRNPFAGIELRREKPRQVRLEISELPKLEKAIDAETRDPYLRAFFRIVLATGCRRGEALSLQWSDVRLTGKEPSVTFRDVKAGGDRTVPLSGHAAALLKALTQIEGNPYVFVGHKHGTHLQAPNVAWDRIRKRAGLPHLRIHDLRRSFGSWLGDAGFTSKQIGTALGHASDITSRVYMALGDQSKRAAVDAVQALMANARKPKRKRKAKVLQFRRGAR